MEGSEPGCTVDDLLFYRREGDPVVHPAVASGYTYSKLRASGMLAHETFMRLEEVATVVAEEGRLCETEELLDAWLDAFELAASVHDEDLRPKEDWRAEPMQAGRTPQEGSQP